MRTLQRRDFWTGSKARLYYSTYMSLSMSTRAITKMSKKERVVYDTMPSRLIADSQQDVGALNVGRVRRECEYDGGRWG